MHFYIQSRLIKERQMKPRKNDFVYINIYSNVNRDRRVRSFLELEVGSDRPEKMVDMQIRITVKKITIDYIDLS